jgi:hypothetical protein
MLRYELDARKLAVSDLRCSMIYDLSNLLPPTSWRPKGVGEADVLPMGP